MWEHWRNRRFDAMRSRMAADARLVGGERTLNRDQAIEEMQKERCDVRSVLLQDVSVSLASPAVALITYRSKLDGSCDGNPSPQAGNVNTSVWARREGRWVLVLHHQSRAPR